MTPKKEESSGEEKPKRRGRPKGVKDSKPRKKKLGHAGERSGAPKEDADLSVPPPAVPPAPRPSSLRIEPDTPPAAAPEDDADIETMPWPEEGKPKLKGPLWSHDTGDRDLSLPPDVLLKGRPKPALAEVEDILEEPEDEAASERAMLRPPVRNGLFRKLAIAFIVPVVLVLGVVAYVTYARSTITIHPARETVMSSRVVTVAAVPEGTDEIAGEVREITVGGEKTGFPSGSTLSDGVASGLVTLVNDTDQAFTLVATTRLLTPDGVLFRLRNQTTIPPRGEIKAEAYADQPGKGGDIGPTTFTIPGLRAETQRVVYARSEEAMTGGVAAKGVASEEDIARLEEELMMDLSNEAQEELAARVEGTWTGQAFEKSVLSRFVNVRPGEETDRIVIRLSLRVRSVSFDRAAALDAVVEDLKRSLTSDRELVAVDGDAAKVEIERVDAASGKAAIRVTLSGETSVTLSSPLFDAAKLKGLDLDAVQSYFEGIEGIERIDVRFRPFWIKRMPDLPDHIELKIAK